MNVSTDYDVILEGLPEAVLLTDKEGTIRFFNPAAERVTGYSASEVLGQNILTLVPQREDRRVDPLEWFERWSREPDDMQSRFLDLLAKAKCGREFPVNVRVRAATVGGEEQFIVTFRDVSEMRADQAKFRDAHLRATRVLQIAEDAIISIDADQKITFLNIRAEELFGYSQEELLGKSVDALLPEAARAKHHSQVEGFGKERIPAKRMGQRGEIMGLAKNGEVIPFEASITCIHVGGNPTYTAHLRDVREQKKVRQALEQSEMRFRAIFENAYQAMALLDQTGNVLEINPSARAMTVGGVPLEGLPLWELPWEFEGRDANGEQEVRDRLKNAVTEAMAGKPSHFREHGEAEDGTARELDLDIVPVTDDAGKVIYLVAEGRDISGADLA